MDQAYYQTGERRLYQEMRQKPARDTFFSFKDESQAQRPTSVATEFVDTDWDEELLTEAEDNSPRVSLQSSGQPSFTTVSTYDEVPTPRSSQGRDPYGDPALKPVEGPRGPHLFRSSTDPSFLDEDAVLTLSPLTPKVTRVATGFLERPPLPRRSSPFQYADEELDTSTLASWSPEMVAQSMLNAGIETSVADRFVENDINGAILITLKFEDLRELDIPSFGIRTRVWHQIQALRDSRPTSPRPATPIEDIPSREAKRETRQPRKNSEEGLKRRQSSKRRQRRKHSADDVITPMESVSIIGIEQVIPKSHNCSKGENCSKWRRQQRAIAEFRKANPHVDMGAGGTVMIFGDAGNPDTARALDPNDVHRPFSDAVPSVVASSDILGAGGLPPLQYLQEATLRNMQARDAQDNVRQFLNFQHQQNKDADEVPPTPPFELAPAAKPAHRGLRRLPKLSIPSDSLPQRQPPPRAATVPPPTELQEEQTQRRQTQGFLPYRMAKADPLSPDLETPKNPYRLASPLSELEVPLTAIPAGPIPRDASQSVPPDMGDATTPEETSNGVTFQGPMKKRKTRLLRHEWQDGYFTIKGTRLNMHKDISELGRTLEYVDIDDYAIACSSLASTSKLSAAFKAMHISHSREKSDPIGSFCFQLIPQEKETGGRLRKRESSLYSTNRLPSEGVNGTGKTHHFAVKNRDDRIDWMRELMLAKALKQKGDGFEISVNGNMI
ncbi:SAM and PH domain-containing protein [Purpureocillium lavendulum]|uniref:SAM and PH domain-containing protein n=1 Tax=Purpureocillium lavendulum TaxID=1247861 RepID=A0AB34G5L0_9HYPO|nr:SAM and PH domain-containing protein [Purpureocillium lavendulum]